MCFSRPWRLAEPCQFEEIFNGKHFKSCELFAMNIAPLQDIFERIDVAHSGSVYLGDFVSALTCVPKGRSVEVGNNPSYKQIPHLNTI